MENHTILAGSTLTHNITSTLIQILQLPNTIIDFHPTQTLNKNGKMINRAKGTMRNVQDRDMG
jgi:hypothetical protein